jgi:hypothetical protein
MLSILFMILAGAAYATDVPYVTDDMNTPDHWISRHVSPDRVVMTSGEIAAFNQDLQAQGLTDDLASFPSAISREKVGVDIERLITGVPFRDLFRQDGLKADEALYTAWTQNMALAVLEERSRVRYAFTVSFTDERLFPTDEPLYEKPGDVDFDQVQNSGLDPGTPVLVFHESADGRWFFVKDGIASGWVKREKLALCDRAPWLRAVTGKDRAVVTAPSAPVYLDKAMAQPVAVARMGSRFVVKRIRPGSVEIIYPLRHADGTARFVSAFLPAKDIIRGFLPYTPRTVITQAFKLLGAPYGWGDMNGNQDCSRFIQMVFSTMGLDLPRNSGEQGRSGLSLAEWNSNASAKEKFALIDAQGDGGVTLLRLKGHIMLYLGRDKDRIYAIHAVWAYRQKGPEGDKATVLGRVVVSDLSLGEGSSKGSLLERVVAVRVLKHGDPISGEAKR